MLTCVNSTEVRKDMGHFIDSIIREKPKVIKRSRDYVFTSSIEMLKELLKNTKFTANLFKEADGTITASLNEVDIVVNGENEEQVMTLLVNDLSEYAQDYYNEFNYWFSAPNRKEQLPYILNVLIQDNIDGVKGLIKCLPGEN